MANISHVFLKSENQTLFLFQSHNPVESEASRVPEHAGNWETGRLYRSSESGWCSCLPCNHIVANVVVVYHVTVVAIGHGLLEKF